MSLRLALPALLLVGCPKPAPPAPDTTADVEDLCRRALFTAEHGRQPSSPDVSLCVDRFGSGSPEELELLGCQADAASHDAWAGCFADQPPLPTPGKVVYASVYTGPPSKTLSGLMGVETPTKEWPADLIILGALDRSVIDEVVEADMPGLAACYAEGLDRDDGLRGQVVIKFVVASNGSVSKASIKSSTLADQGVQECVRARMAELSFEEPPGGGIVIVSYPFVFAPE